jgi:hypothetical protein
MMALCVSLGPLAAQKTWKTSASSSHEDLDVARKSSIKEAGELKLFA